MIFFEKALIHLLCFVASIQWSRLVCRIYLEDKLCKYILEPLQRLFEVLLVECRECWRGEVKAWVGWWTTGSIQLTFFTFNCLEWPYESRCYLFSKVNIVIKTCIKIDAPKGVNSDADFYLLWYSHPVGGRPWVPRTLPPGGGGWPSPRPGSPPSWPGCT